MRLTWTLCVAVFALGAPAGKTASGTLTLGGKAVTLTHALAFDAGATKLILITEGPVPREEVKSEFLLTKYNFDKQPVGMVLWLDSANKLTSGSSMSARVMTDVTKEIELTLTGTSAGTLSGTVKSKPGATKLKLDATFNASTKP